MPNWKHSNKEEGPRRRRRSQVGGVAYIGGNFTQTADHSGHTVAAHLPRRRERRPPASLTGWSPTLNGRVYALGSIA